VFKQFGAASEVKLVTPCPAIVAEILTRWWIDVGYIRRLAEPAKVSNHNLVDIHRKTRKCGGAIRVHIVQSNSGLHPVTIPFGIAADANLRTLQAVLLMGTGITDVERRRGKVFKLGGRIQPQRAVIISRRHYISCVFFHAVKLASAACEVKPVTPCPAIVAEVLTRRWIDVGYISRSAEPAKVSNHNFVEIPRKTG
jgi:hypothetical protein